jgi:ribosomal protein S18 acetylase RimI-like enzyme
MSSPAAPAASSSAVAPAVSGVPSWTLLPASAPLLPQIALLEEASYPADEMCSAENFAYRLKHAGPFFKVAIEQQNDSSSSSSSPVPRVLGFVVGTLSVDAELHHQAMFEHAPKGQYLCIHSVVTAPELRRKGLARAMLQQYTASVRREQGTALKAIVLICKQNLVHFYTSCGFALVGPSKVQHGADPWFECRMKLDDNEQQQQPQPQAQEQQ